MSHWHERASAAIDAVDRALPASATIDERRRAVDAAYPFGLRRHHPYKIWLKARGEYLRRYGDGRAPGAPVDWGPLFDPPQREQER